MPAGLKLARKKRKPPQAEIPFIAPMDRAVIATDLDGIVTFWNSAAERIYGWKWDEVAGRPVTEFVVPTSEQSNAAEIMQQLCAGKSWTGKFRLRQKDGTEFMATITDEPIRDSDGRLIGIIGISDREDDGDGQELVP